MSSESSFTLNNKQLLSLKRKGKCKLFIKKINFIAFKDSVGSSHLFQSNVRPSRAPYCASVKIIGVESKNSGRSALLTLKVNCPEDL